LAVKIRLQRLGRKKKPFFRIIVIDSRKRRDGRYLEKIGYYDPLTKPATVKIDKEKVLAWLEKGAIPSDTVFNLLQKEGIALEWHLIRNKVGEKSRNIELQKWELAKKERETKSTETPVEEKIEKTEEPKKEDKTVENTKPAETEESKSK